MATTPHIGITLVEQSQAQKEVTVNQALTRIDAVLGNGAKSRILATPPTTPTSGDLYIIAASPTGAWAGQAGKLAFYDTIWRFITPVEGMTVWVNNEDVLVTFDGTNWIVSDNLFFRNIATGIAAAGTNQATATVLSNVFNVVTTVAAGQGVVLPSPKAGDMLIVANQGANLLSVYPASGHSINALSANAALSLAVDVRRIFFAVATNKWYSL
jgi:hypothetical protein